MTRFSLSSTLRRAPEPSSSRGPSKPGLLAGALIVASMGFVNGASAQDRAPGADESAAPLGKAECAQAFEQSQRLRNSFRYLEASSEALKCASPGCGAVLSEECSKIFDELQAATPSIVFGARDESGKELAGVTVRVDGQPQGTPIDGTPRSLDPGNHDFTFLADGFEPTVQSVVIRTGERFRPITGVLKTASTASRPPDGSGSERERPSASRGGPPLATYVLGGVGLVGLAGFVAFRISGSQEFDSLSRDCKPTCSPDSVDAVRRKYLFSNIGLAVGGAATVGALSVYLVSRKTQSPAAALQIWPAGGGATARLTARF